MFTETMMTLIALIALIAVSATSTLGAATRANKTESGLSACDPLDPSKCYLPYPNNFWLRNGKLDLSTDTFPPNSFGTPFNATRGGWNTLDGFSPVMPVLSYWPHIDLERSDVPRVWNVSRSLDHDCPTVLIDATTGELIPHFVELDHRSDAQFPNGTGYNRVFMLWPTHALVNGRRYIVAMRNLRSGNGSLLGLSTAFASLRDGTPSSDPDVELRRALFKDIFASLDRAGVQQNELQLAWDYTIVSKAGVTDRLVFMRQDGFKRVPSIGPQYKIWQVDDNYSDTIFRRIQGTMMVPLYTKVAGPNTTLVLGPDGLPVYQHMTGANFTVLVPRSVANGTFKRASVMQYGHGLFGSRREVQSGYLGGIANRNGYVMVATDWWGLDENDAVYVAVMFAYDISDFQIVPDRCHQGMLNALLAMRMVTGGFSKDPYMKFVGNYPVSSASSRYYYGNSQGGILGTVYMGITTDVTRGLLGVPGGPYSLLLPRSVDFVPFWTGFLKAYKDPVDRITLISLIQGLWDRLEPGGYMSHITHDTLPDTPPHEVLIHYGVGDAQVSYLGAYTIGRSVGASMFASNVKEANQTTFGFPYIADSAVGHTAMIVGWEFPNVPPVPQMNIPPNKPTDTHDKVRETTTAQEMMTEFFATGQIKNVCGGTCKGPSSSSSV